MKLEGKCVKVIDSDITENTYWSKCYSYVITKNIHVLNNVKLTIQNGARVYLLNGEFNFYYELYLGGGIIFDAGSKLCAGNLLFAAVVFKDGKYVLSTKVDIDINNNGIVLFGTKEELKNISEDKLVRNTITKDNIKTLSKTDKIKLYRKKLNDLKKNMVKEKNQPSRFVFNSLTLNYIGTFNLVDLDSKEFFGKNITIFNNVDSFISYNSFNLYNANICLDNLKILIRNPIIQETSTSLGLDNSTLTINKSLVVKGGLYFLVNNNFFDKKSYIVLNKCSKVIIEVAYLFNFYNFGITIIEPKGILPNKYSVPYIVNKCLNQKVVITLTE